jgi:hypothetical protein
MEESDFYKQLEEKNLAPLIISADEESGDNAKDAEPSKAD